MFRYSTSKSRNLEIRVRGHSRSIKVVPFDRLHMISDTYRSATHDVLLTFLGNHEPFSYRFCDKPRFQSKIANFSHHRVFCVPVEGVSIGWAIGSKNQNHKATGPRKKFDDIFSHMDTIHQRDGQTDGQMDRRHRPTAKTALTHSVAR